MRVSKIALSTLTAMSLVAVPVIASANPASSLSVANSVARSGAPAVGVNDARGNSGKKRGGGFIIAILAAAAIIAGIIIAANNNNNPTSR